MHEDESQETKFNLNPLYHDLEFKLTKPLVEYFLLEKYYIPWQLMLQLLEDILICLK